MSDYQVINNGSYCSETMSSKIFLSICPLLLLFGTFTNIFSLLVLSRKRMRKHSTYVYLAFLSVIDLLALWLGIIRDYLAHGYGIYIRSMWLCKIHSFMFYFTLDLSSWILVAVSLDRFFAITFIFSAYTRKLLLKIAGKPKFVCSFLCVFFFVLNLHFVLYVELDVNKEQHKTWQVNTKPYFTLNHTDLVSRLLPDTKSKYFYYLSNGRHLKFDKSVYQANSVIEFDENQTGTNLVILVLPLLKQQQQGGTNESTATEASSDKHHSIGVFDEYLYCVMDKAKNPTYVKFFVNIWPFIDLSMYAILPFCIMFVCNIAIIKNVKFSSNPFDLNKKKTKNNLTKIDEEIGLNSSSTAIPIHHNNIELDNISTRNSITLNQQAYPNNSCNKNNIEISSLRKSRSLTNQNLFRHSNKSIGSSTSILLKNFQTRNIKMMSLTIISITCIFILLTLPIMLFIILMKLSSSSKIDKNLSYLGSLFANMDPSCKSILWAVVNIFMYTNHSINFVMYCLTGSKFRTELATLFLPKHFTLSNSNTNNVISPYNENQSIMPISMRNFTVRNSIYQQNQLLKSPMRNSVNIRSSCANMNSINSLNKNKSVEKKYSPFN